MTTINENIIDDIYGYPERICDNCEKLIDGQMHLHWAVKDFDLCSVCLMELYEKVFESNSIRKKANDTFRKVSIPKEFRWKIWQRDDFTCQYCGARDDLSIDHIFPESKGGKLIDSNLVTACKTCNSRKNNRTPEEANMKLLNDPRN